MKSQNQLLFQNGVLITIQWPKEGEDRSNATTWRKAVLHLHAKEKLLSTKGQTGLNSMLQQRVIPPITVPTTWYSGLVPVPKANGNVRLYWPWIVAAPPWWTVKTAHYFCNFVWPLQFQPPSIRHKFQRQRFSKVPCLKFLKDLDGETWQISSLELIKKNTTDVFEPQLHCLLEADITVNIENCQFFKTSVKFLGSFIDEQEILAGPMKTEAISQFPPPQTVKDLQRFRG